MTNSIDKEIRYLEDRCMALDEEIQTYQRRLDILNTELCVEAIDDISVDPEYTAHLYEEIKLVRLDIETLENMQYHIIKEIDNLLDVELLEEE